ncbi:MAG: hypothetical protein R6U50_04555 [Desulfobacterales bacterium]
MEDRWRKNYSAFFREIMVRDPDGPILLLFLTLNSLSIETIRSTPERVNMILEDLMAIVEFADRFSIRFADRVQGRGISPHMETFEKGRIA